MSQLIVAFIAFILAGGNFFLFLLYSAIGYFIVWGLRAPDDYRKHQREGDL